MVKSHPSRKHEPKITSLDLVFEEMISDPLFYEEYVTPPEFDQICSKVKNSPAVPKEEVLFIDQDNIPIVDRRYKVE